MSEAEEKPVKKGTASWRPAKALEVKEQRPGMRLRWVNTDPENVRKKQAEGWTYSKQEHDRPKGVEHGKNIGTVSQYRDLVLMEIPEDMAQARTEFYRKETQAQVGGITKRIKNKIAEGNAASYGEVQITDKPI